MFITGATGYLGLVLIYKLLMYCPDIGNLYLLIRNSDGPIPILAIPFNGINSF